MSGVVLADGGWGLDGIAKSPFSSDFEFGIGYAREAAAQRRAIDAA